MTFVAVFCGPNHAFIATDTRISLMQGGERADYYDTERKLVPLTCAKSCGGWAAASGAGALVDPALESLRGVDIANRKNMTDAARKAYDNSIPARVRERLYELQPVNELYAIGADEAGTWLSILDERGANKKESRRMVLIRAPLGVSEEDTDRMAKECAADLIGLKHSLDAQLDASARWLQAFADITPYVSRVLVAGIVCRTADGFVRNAVKLEAVSL